MTGQELSDRANAVGDLMDATALNTFGKPYHALTDSDKNAVWEQIEEIL